MKTKKQRAEYIGKKLDELYPEIPIPLDHTDAYTLLIAVLHSAQCTDKRVNMVTPALFAKVSTPQDMASFPSGKYLNAKTRVFPAQDHPDAFDR